MLEDEAIRYVHNLEEEYKRFMGIDTFPEYQLRFIGLETNPNVRYNSLANDRYDFTADTHILTVSSLVINQRADEVLFHEFTYMLDERKYCKGDKLKYSMNAGYTEYHAAQVDLMKMVGADTIDKPKRFSMNDTFVLFGKEFTVAEYMLRPYNAAVEIFHMPGFASDIETLHSWMGLLFNYWGYRSICEMYADGFDGCEANMGEFSQFFSQLGNNPIEPLKVLLKGWVSDNHVMIVDCIYGAAFDRMIDRCNLAEETF